MIQVIGRAIDILEFLAAEPERARSLGEIAASTGLNPATCANILKTLVARGVVEQTAPRKGYVLGPLPYLLTRNGPYRKDLTVVAEPLVRHLVEQVGETALVATITRGRRSVLFQIEGTRVVSINPAFLLRQDVYMTATGRLLLAHLPREEREAVFRENGMPDGKVWQESATAAGLLRALEEIRRQEFLVTVTQGEVCAIAFPIREHGCVVAALGLYLPAFRFTGAHRREILDGMRAVAEEIGARLDRRGAGKKEIKRSSKE